MNKTATNPPQPRAPFDRAKPYGLGNGIECADNAGFILGVSQQAPVDADTQREHDDALRSEDVADFKNEAREMRRVRFPYD